MAKIILPSQGQMAVGADTPPHVIFAAAMRELINVMIAQMEMLGHIAEIAEKIEEHQRVIAETTRALVDAGHSDG